MMDNGSGKLHITQEYLFTDYGNSPSHEPNGNLRAARLFPLLRFTFSNATKQENTPKYIRIDYRLELFLDQHLSRPSEALLGYGPSPGQAGIFADNDDPNTFLAAPPIVPPMLGLDNIFDRGEKPLKYEIIGHGLDKGRRADWDNIHYWANSPIEGTPRATTLGNPSTNQKMCRGHGFAPFPKQFLFRVRSDI